MFDYAIKIGLISQNPFKLLSSFKISKDQKSPKDNFSMDELVKIFKTDKKSLKIIWRLPCIPSLDLAKFGA